MLKAFLSLLILIFAYFGWRAVPPEVKVEIKAFFKRHGYALIAIVAVVLAVLSATINGFSFQLF